MRPEAFDEADSCPPSIRTRLSINVSILNPKGDDSHRNQDQDVMSVRRFSRKSRAVSWEEHRGSLPWANEAEINACHV